MADNKGLLSVKLDLVFKLIFGDQRNTDILSELRSNLEKDIAQRFTEVMTE